MARHAVSFAGYLRMGLRTLVPLSVARHTGQDLHAGGSCEHKWNLAEVECDEVKCTVCELKIGR